MSEDKYRQLLKDNIRGLITDDTKRKKRKTGGSLDSKEKEVLTISESPGSFSDSDDFDPDEFEDVELEQGEDTSDGLKDTRTLPDVITVKINRKEMDTKKSKHIKVISKEERQTRYLIHKMYLGFMTIHGVIRNRWCNDYKLMAELKKKVPNNISELLNQEKNTTLSNMHRSRNFLDGVRKLMLYYSGKFRIRSQGLVRKNWNELQLRQSGVERNVTFQKFSYLMSKYEGSRDISAQGFVALSRSIGLNARLVFSIQTPDFTLISQLPKIMDVAPESRKEKSTVLSGMHKLNKDLLLSSIRKQKSRVAGELKYKANFPNSTFPIFWVEVWDKFSKKWISVDPAVQRIVEVISLRKKSKLEPPLSDPTNQLSYVLAYDRLGGITDVTRRYSLQFNAKTFKKRIEYKGEFEHFWYSRLLDLCRLSLRRNRPNKIDIIEMKEFHDRDLVEGFPNSLSDFKNHPLYAIESQLKKNEIIYPKDDANICGFFRNKSAKSKTSGALPVYKRSNVHVLRSAKAWYIRGRVLKVGAQPLKVVVRNKKGNTGSGEDDEDEEADGRLYAQFQTKLYIPTPVTDGKIPKNAYGNIDVYVPSMIPENGSLVKASDKCSLKLLEKAARLLGVDYAKAVIGFDFGRKSSKRFLGKAQAKEGGIVIPNDNREAFFAVLDYLVDEEEEESRNLTKYRALSAWKFLLTNLRISQRLNREHGDITPSDQENEQAIDSTTEVGPDETSSQEVSYLTAHEPANDGPIQAGGFLVEDTPIQGSLENPYSVEDSHGSRASFSSEDIGGGFLIEEHSENNPNFSVFSRSPSQVSFTEKDQQEPPVQSRTENQLDLLVTSATQPQVSSSGIQRHDSSRLYSFSASDSASSDNEYAYSHKSKSAYSGSVQEVTSHSEDPFEFEYSESD